jgi:hypothetical protein
MTGASTLCLLPPRTANPALFGMLLSRLHGVISHSENLKSRIVPPFLISTLDGGERSLYARYALHRRLGGFQGRSGRCGEQINFCPCRESKVDPRHVARRYTDSLSLSKVSKHLSLCLTPWRRMAGEFRDPHFLDLGTSRRWVISFTLRPLYPREKSPPYPLDRRLGGPHSRSGRRGEEKILDPTGTRTLTPRPSSP